MHQQCGTCDYQNKDRLSYCTYTTTKSFNWAMQRLRIRRTGLTNLLQREMLDDERGTIVTLPNECREIIH